MQSRQNILAIWFGGVAALLVFLLLIEPIADGVRSWWFMFLLGLAVGRFAPMGFAQLRERLRKQRNTNKDDSAP